MTKTLFRRFTLRLAALAAIVCLAPAALRAEDAGLELPDHLAAHVTVRAPAGLIAGLDGYVANATNGTGSPVAAGLITLLAQMYMPVPFAVWDADAELHFLVLKAPMPGAQGAVAVLSADSFDAFVEGLEDNGAEIAAGDEDCGPALEKSAAIKIPGMGTLTAAELPDGRVALAMHPAALAMAFAEASPWLPPARKGDADVTAVFIFDAGSLDGFVRTELEPELRKGLAAVADKGFNPEVLDGLATGLADAFAVAFAQFDMLNAIGVELWLDDDTLRARANGDWDEKAFAREAAARLRGKGNVDSDLAERVGRDAATVGVSAPFDHLMADGADRMSGFTADVFAAAFPDHRDRIHEAFTGMFNQMDGGYVTGAYLKDGVQTSAAWFRTADPAALAAAADEMVVVFNEMLDAGIEDPGLKLRIVSATGATDGIDYVRYSPDFADREKFVELLSEASPADANSRKLMDLVGKHTFYMGVKDGVALLLAGAVTDEDFAAMWRYDAKRALVNSAPARTVRAELPNRQASMGIMSLDPMFVNLAKGYYETQGSYSDSSRLSLEALEAMLPHMEDTGEVFGFAGGEEDGMLHVDWVVPASTVNAGIRHYELLEKTKRDLQDGAGEAAEESD